MKGLTYIYIYIYIYYIYRFAYHIYIYLYNPYIYIRIYIYAEVYTSTKYLLHSNDLPTRQKYTWDDSNSHQLFNIFKKKSSGAV